MDIYPCWKSVLSRHAREILTRCPRAVFLCVSTRSTLCFHPHSRAFTWPFLRSWVLQKHQVFCRLRVVPIFPQGYIVVERAKRKRAWKSPHARKGSPPRVAFSRVGRFSRALAFRSLYYPWGKMWTTRSLVFCGLLYIILEGVALIAAL